MIEKLLGYLLCIGPVILIFFVIAFLKGKKKKSEMAQYSYDEIASKFYLWDAYVNCYHIDSRGKLATYGEKVKADYLDYDAFFARPKEEKLRMLISEFGEESK